MAVVEDIAPALLEQLQEDFHERIKKSRRLQDLLKLVTDGKATYIEAEEIAYEMGTALSQTFGNCLSSAVLPDGKMYFNIAQRVIGPLLEEDHQLLSQITEQVQASLNKKASIGLKAQTVAVDEDRIYGIVNKISEAETFDDMAWMLGDPVVNFSQNVVDSIMKTNVNFQGKAGLRPKIIRKAESRCCKWCRNLAGVYEYPMVPDDVYRRHERCRCQVDYDPGDGRRQNVHTKQWKNAVDRDKIEERKQIKGISTPKDGQTKDTTVMDAIARGTIKDEINPNKQGKHIKGSSEYQEGKSYIYGGLEEAEQLYNQLKGTGESVYGADKQWMNKERVANDKPIGVWIDKNGEEVESSAAMIVYSNTGSHIYPRKEEK